MTPSHVCNVCFNEYPLTRDYFWVHKLSSTGFRKTCKICCNGDRAAFTVSHKKIPAIHVLRDRLGYSHSQIAADMGISIPAVTMALRMRGFG